jgi:putative hydrolase of the HAD superfamily
VGTLLWDFDGTLGFRHGGMWGAAVLEVLTAHTSDLTVSLDQLRPYLQSGLPWHSPEVPHPDLVPADRWWDALNPVLVQALQGVGLDPDLARHLAPRVRHVYTSPERWRLYDDTIPTLRALSAAGWQHTILSNHVPELPGIVRHLELDDYMDHVLNSAATGYEKPHPRAYGIALERVAATGPVWMLGDNYRADVAGAEAVGLQAILVRKRHPGARFYCPGLGDVVTLLVRGSPLHWEGVQACQGCSR